MNIFNFTITRSTWLHLRFPFSIFLLPVFVFALSQAPQVFPGKTFLVFVIWHLFVYPASNGYNSYFDKDEGSIALIENPPPVDKSLYFLSLFLDIIGFILSLLVSYELALAVLIYSSLSKLYSHPSTRLKKYPVLSFLIVFLFQGAFIYWVSYSSISGSMIVNDWNLRYLIAGLVCSCLIGASYPLTQIYQHEEDARRGDRTLSFILGIKGSFLFSALLFLSGMILLFAYWHASNNLNYFWIFLVFAAGVGYAFITWYLKVRKDQSEADFKNMTKMTVTSSILMLLYFIFLWIMK